MYPSRAVNTVRIPRRIMSKQPANELRRIRKVEGLKITELAALAGVSTKTIQVLEYRTRGVSSETKHKIVNGLNARPNRQREYGFKHVFPNDPEF
jgi:transcriptional regulator with XRE-family HTH domain